MDRKIKRYKTSFKFDNSNLNYQVMFRKKRNDLNKKENQTSPKDLWMLMPFSEKNPYKIRPDNSRFECGDSSFRGALTALQTYGVASLQTVPYQMQDCCDKVSGIGDENNKIAKWRLIARNYDNRKEGMTIDNFKRYINNNYPVIFGGSPIGARFMGWRGSRVFEFDDFDKTNPHSSGHAMILVGYDDCRQAFRVRNSWDSDWGDEGSIWIDYNYFINSFCDDAFIAVLYDDDNLDPSPNSGRDMMISFALDIEVEGNEGYHKLTFDICNSGDSIITPDKEWMIACMLYNAKNAKEHYIISYDFVSSRFQEREHLVERNDVLCGHDIYVNFKLSPKTLESKTFEYQLPDSLNGKYYIAIVADVMDAIDEANERNNFWFIGDENGEPLLFDNGKMLNKPATLINDDSILPDPFSDHPNQTLVKPGNLNTYTPGEIKRLIQCELNKRITPIE